MQARPFRNGICYVRWRVNKKLFMRSTGERDIKKAKAKRDEILAPFLAGREVDVLRNVSARIEGHTAMTRHYTHIGEAAATTAVAALPDITGTAKPALPAGETVTVPAATLRELAEGLTAETAAKVRAELVALLGDIQAA